MVIVCKAEAKALSELSVAAFADLKAVTSKVEPLLKGFVAYERINYTALMMVDPDVHFHCFPRYPEARAFEGTEFPDAGWPGAPRFDTGVKLEGEILDRLTAELRGRWEALA